MGGDGDVFVLDIGEPVKIIDLAKRMIKLMGHVEKNAESPNGEIEIQFIGLRPGEKLFEELLLGDRVIGTGHPKILRAQEEWLPEEKLHDILKSLQRACTDGDCTAMQHLLALAVKGFETSVPISDEVWLREGDVATSKKDNVYTLFANE
jgi:FlaA1/EpsC-like NDP-sugar epimerase